MYMNRNKISESKLKGYLLAEFSIGIAIIIVLLIPVFRYGSMLLKLGLREKPLYRGEALGFQDISRKSYGEIMEIFPEIEEFSQQSEFRIEEVKLTKILLKDGEKTVFGILVEDETEGYRKLIFNRENI